MDYALLIEERKSTRAFKNKAVPVDVANAIRSYHDNSCMRLIPEIETEAYIAGADIKEALEGAAGYKEYFTGAPSYFVLLSKPHENAIINAGYITQDISIKLAETGYGSCFVTFTDKEAIKKVIDITSPNYVIPIHTEAKERFKELAGDKLLLANDNEDIRI